MDGRGEGRREDAVRTRRRRRGDKYFGQWNGKNIMGVKKRVDVKGRGYVS